MWKHLNLVKKTVGTTVATESCADLKQFYRGDNYFLKKNIQ